MIDYGIPPQSKGIWLQYGFITALIDSILFYKTIINSLSYLSLKITIFVKMSFLLLKIFGNRFPYVVCANVTFVNT